MSKKLSKASLIGAILAPAITTVVACTSCGKLPPIKRDCDAHILDINDFHGAAAPFGEDEKDYQIEVSYHNPGIERLAEFYDGFLQDHPSTVFLAAGDNNSGDCFSTVTHAKTLYPLLKALGVRYSAVGNHAFEWGKEYMSGITIDKDGKKRPHETFDEWARTDETDGNYFVCANILDGSIEDDEYHWKYDKEDDKDHDYSKWKKNKVSWADPYKIINFQGHPVCLIGLLTKGTRKDGNQKAISDLGFIDYQASVHYAKHLAQEELGKDYDKIESFILLTHVECDFVKDKEGTITNATGAAAELAATLDTDIDAVIAGHSHKKGCYPMHNLILKKDVWVGQADTAGKAILDTNINFKYEGNKLTKQVSMEILDQEKYKSDEYEKAKEELLETREYAKTRGWQSPLRKVCEEYEKQRRLVKYEFESSVGRAKTNGLAYPVMHERSKLGHEYVWPNEYYPAGTPDFLVEQMGGWENYATIEGFNLLNDETAKLPKPWISFNNWDSLTHEIPVIPEGRNFTKGDIYQLLTYENDVYFGYLTVAQLCHILNYMVVGKGMFSYVDKEGPQYKEKTDLLNDYILGTKYEGMTLPNSIRYLCGPLQEWGLSCEFQKYQSTDPENKREWELKFEESGGKKIPTNLKIYNPNKAGANIKDSSTWMDVKELGDAITTTYIPIVVSGFIYTGGNNQNTMFKMYMEYNDNATKGQYPVYKVENAFTRDPVFRFLESIEDEQNVDLDINVVHGITKFGE